MSITVLSPDSNSHSGDEPRPRPWAALAIAGCLVLAHLPLLAEHAQLIWLRPHYQFFPLVVGAAVILLITRIWQLGELTPPSTVRAALAFIGAAVVLLVAELLHSSWLGAVSAILSAGVALFAVGGNRLLRAGLPALVVLSVAIPPPFELDRTLILALQGWTARWGSRVLDLLGVYHVLAGHVVETPGRQFFVEEACSGVNSLFSVIGCTLFFVFFNRRSLLVGTLLLVAAVSWVLAANVVRVAGVVYLATVHGIDLADGLPHTALGYVLFGVVLLLLLSTDQLLLFLTASPDGAKAEPAAAPTRWPGTAPWLAWVVSAAFCMLLLSHLALYGSSSFLGRPAASADGSDRKEPEATALPQRVGRWEQQEFTTLHRNAGSEYGEFSRVWIYQFGAHRATVSLDQPFPSWHDLTHCYTSQGWIIDDETIRPEGFVQLKLTKPAYRSGYLLFAQFNRDGEALEPRRSGPFLSLRRHDSVLQRLWTKTTGGAAPSDPPGPILQLQVFVETFSPLSDEEETEAREFFAHALKNMSPAHTDVAAAAKN
jgi:exosortase